MTGTQWLDPVLDLLLRARGHLSNPDNWCQDLIQRDGRHCLVGTLKLVGGCDMEQFTAAVDMACSSLNVTLVEIGEPEMVAAEFNDASPHEDVLALVDLTIERRCELATV